MYGMILSTCIGYIIAVMWVDLIFDSLTLPYRDSHDPLPEEVLGTMSSFFKRITYKPRLIFIALATIFVMIIREFIDGSVPIWVAWASFILVILTGAFAVLRVIPSARRLGSRMDSIEKQSELARSLFSKHSIILAMMAILLVLQLYAAR